MKMFRVRWMGLAVFLILSLSACAVSVSGEGTETGQSKRGIVFNSAAVAVVTPVVMIQRIGKGINMGNVLDAPYEGAWAAPAQEYYFDDYKAAGFNSVRIPVTWSQHIGMNAPYTVDPVFMARVSQVVDWALARNLAVVLDCHHEDWIRTNYPAAMVPRFDALWTQIAANFANRSENLVFEVMNEPNGAITAAQVNDMNSRALKIIRQTNPTRCVVMSGRNWNNSYTLISEVNFPNDPYLIANFHCYDPWNFCGNTSGGVIWGTASDIASLTSEFKNVKDWAAQKNIPVMVNEFGAVKEADSVSRITWYQTLCNLARTDGFAYLAWDDSGSYGIYNRSARTWETAILNILIGPANSAAGPAGYTYCADENQSYTFNQSVDLAYGASGKFNYKTGVTGTITFNNATFGDPDPGVVKKGYYKVIGVSSSSSSSSRSSSTASGVVYTTITAPFVFDGAGTYHWKMAAIPSYINGWNLAVLNINGVSFLNLYISPSQLPAKQGGYYYIDYTGPYAWSHFEAK